MGSDDVPLAFVGASRKGLDAFPGAVRRRVGFALRLAQEGKTPADAKPLQGFGGASVLELVLAYGGDAYRCVYTVRFIHAVYMLHCFQKKSTQGIKTSPRDLDVIRRRLAEAARQDAKMSEQQTRGGEPT